MQRTLTRSWRSWSRHNVHGVHTLFLAPTRTVCCSSDSHYPPLQDIVYIPHESTPGFSITRSLWVLTYPQPSFRILSLSCTSSSAHRYRNLWHSSLFTGCLGKTADRQDSELLPYQKNSRILQIPKCACTARKVKSFPSIQFPTTYRQTRDQVNRHKLCRLRSIVLESCVLVYAPRFIDSWHITPFLVSEAHCVLI